MAESVKQLQVNGKMTAWEPLRLARRIMVDTALSMTKMAPPMRRACRLVLVEGKTAPEAAAAVKRSRQAVHKALATLQPHYDAVKAEVDRQVSDV